MLNEDLLKLGIVGIIVSCIAYVITVIRKVYAQSDKNKIEEINLLASKIELNNTAKPIDQLVDESNRTHNSEMEREPGINTKKR